MQTEQAKLGRQGLSAAEGGSGSGRADANAILNASLTGAILQQLPRHPQGAAAGNLVVVPEGFNGLRTSAASCTRS